MNKQKLKEQIDTMRGELAKMETELAGFEKVELEDTGIYFESNANDIYTIRGQKPHLKNGAYRKTKELARIACANAITRNKLEAYAHQIDPEWIDGGIGNKAYKIIRYNHRYGISFDESFRSTGTVYMSKSTAEQICAWLNDGRIEL